MLRLLGALAGALLTTCALADDATPPSVLYGALFEDVQMSRVFPDGKTFVDTVPKREPAAIVAQYRAERGKPGFDLKAFVLANFEVPKPAGSEYRSKPGQDVCSHIEALWSVLERRPDEAAPRSTLLPLPEPYIVPGGRFNEIYYWDSYFTMLGLIDSGLDERVRSMVDNFASLIDRYGHIPNGNRSYYLSRSQPPFFAAMVELVAAEGDRKATLLHYLPALAKEYAFWMEGADTLRPGEAHRRVVRLADGTLLNRYWDDRSVPRDESFREDVETAKRSNRPAPEVYRDLRATAESGMDFSSRWLADGRTLSTIRTTALVPPDLNSLLYRLEATLADAYAADDRPEKAVELRARGELRKAAIRSYLWDDVAGIFTDYLWQEGEPTGHVTAATFYPLYFGIATEAQAERIAAAARDRLLEPGGIATTAIRTGEQWDAPNGWPPLQWIAIKGLADYGETALATTIAERWMNTVVDAYAETGKLMEKYNISDAEVTGGGGEYPTQDGFGWTNGVLRHLLVLYPEAVAPPAGSRWCEAANDNEPAGSAEQPAIAQ
jgi:alpha,alpha-trehalase